ncbi:MAG TPA: hypothetical protein VK151_00930 [Fluviicola sp.]|nr:hypothetical protein [Fluviicola sp.]
MKPGFLFGLVLLVSVTAHAQTDSTEMLEVEKAMMQLFDGMRKGDSTMVRGAFAENAHLSTTYVDENGKPQVEEGSLIGFLIGVGSPHKEVWDERLGYIQISMDDGIAHIWAPYTFYFGERRLHCGVNSFQMVKTDKGWKILNLVDTRRENNCGD